MLAGEIAKAGVDAVDRVAAFDDLFDRLAAGGDPLASLWVEDAAQTGVNDLGELIEGEVVSGYADQFLILPEVASRS